jgi:undecaprenyl diphosphate synthase
VAFAKSSGSDRKAQELLLAGGPLPRHIAIIMDGNGRWAKKRGLPRVAGHTEGVNSVRDIVEACAQLGVKYLTLYTFSTENWKRPKEEVSMLMRLLVKALRDERDKLHENDVRLKVIGEISALPSDVADELLDAIEMMRHNSGLTLVLALSYSGRWDIVRAVREMYNGIRSGILKKEEITEDLIANYLSTAGTPEPDLLIRTSGEMRVSNFLLWQLAYCEMYISEELWPAFRRRQLYAAILDYQKRERRFGKVSEQVRQPKGGHISRLTERINKSVTEA